MVDTSKIEDMHGWKKNIDERIFPPKGSKRNRSIC